MSEPIKIVQFMIGEGDAPDLCLDAEGNLYKMEFVGRHEITLIKQTIQVIVP